MRGALRGRSRIAGAAGAMLTAAGALGGCSPRGQQCASFASGDSIVLGAGVSSCVDLVVVIDNSDSMAEEQAKLRLQIPRLISALVSPPDTDGDGVPDYPPVENLHAGVVSTDLGAGPYSLRSCMASDEAVFVSEYRGTDPACAPSYPRFLSWSAANPTYPVADLTRDLSCLSTLGTSGCGVEQPLEAVYLALTARLSAQGDGRNDQVGNPFLRSECVLAILILSDEEDCSLRDYALIDPMRTDIGTLGLRCFNPNYPGNQESLWPISRYADGLRTDLRPTPRHVVVGHIGGIPVDLGGMNPAAILSDPRMQLQIDPSATSMLIPTCSAGVDGVAYPARRVLQVLQPYYDAGSAVTSSICSGDYGPAVDAVSRRVQFRLANCIEQLLPREVGTCTVPRCRVVETLPDESACPAGRNDGGVVETGGVRRRTCIIPEVTDANPSTPAVDSMCACDHPLSPWSPCTANPTLNGWWYDADASGCDRRLGRVAFSGTGVPAAASDVRMECLAPDDPRPPCP